MLDELDDHFDPGGEYFSCPSCHREWELVESQGEAAFIEMRIDRTAVRREEEYLKQERDRMLNEWRKSASR